MVNIKCRTITLCVFVCKKKENEAANSSERVISVETGLSVSVLPSSTSHSLTDVREK